MLMLPMILAAGLLQQRPVPDNPCDLLTVEQMAKASGLTVLSARREPGRDQPPPGNWCVYETGGAYGGIYLSLVRSEIPLAARFRERREQYFKTYPGAAVAIPNLGIDAWIGGFVNLRVLVRDNVEVTVFTQSFPAGSRGSADVVEAIGRALVRSIGSRPLPQ